MLLQMALFNFLWLIKFPYHIFLIHSSISGPLGCFYVLVIVNSAAVNIRVHVSMRFWYSSLCIYIHTHNVLICWPLNFKCISSILHLYSPFLMIAVFFSILQHYFFKYILFLIAGFDNDICMWMISFISCMLAFISKLPSHS